MAALNFSDFTDLLRENYGDLIVSTIVQSGPGNEIVPEQSILGCLRQAGRVVIGGADSNDRYAREWAVHYATATATSYGASDNYPNATQESFDDASIDWKRVGVMMSFDELVRAASSRMDTRGGNFISYDLKSKLRAIVDKISDDLATDGSGNSSKDVTGFKAFLSSSNTYAGIDQSANSWWQAVVDSTGGNLSKSLVEGVIESLDARNALKPGLQIWMAYNQWNRWKNLFVDSIRRIENRNTSEGFEMVYEDGNVSIPIKLIRNIPNTEVWFPNVNDIEVRFLDQTPSDELDEMDLSEEMTYEGMPIGFKPVYENRDVTNIFCRAWVNAVCSNPYHQAVLTGLNV